MSLLNSVIALATACDPSGATALRAGTHVLTVPAVASGDDTTKVDVLDLSGVDPGELAVLPAPDSVPLDDASVEPAPSSGGVVLPAANPVPSPSATPSPGAPATNRATTGRPEPDVLTRRMATSPFSVLGLTWDQDAGLTDVVIRYRVRVDGAWTRWQGVEASDVDWEVAIALDRLLPTTLEETAVEQHVRVRRANEVHRARHRLRRAHELELDHRTIISGLPHVDSRRASAGDRARPLRRMFLARRGAGGRRMRAAHDPA